MVITIQQNATAEANPSVTKLSKEKNDLKMNELQEYAANNAAGQYVLNLHVIGLNNYSTYAEMIRGYRSMARRFYPDNNYGFDTTEIMTMITRLDMNCKTNCVKMIDLGKKNMSNQQKMIVQFHLITSMIPNQAVHHPNQRHHILDG